MWSLKLCCAGVLVVAAAGCASKTSQDPLASAVTPGAVKKDVIKGVTTQTEVLEILGPPDLLTSKEGREVWTYDKTSYDVETTSGYFTILIAGGNRKTARSSSQSTMVIIYFDENEIVNDYRISLVKY